MNGLNKWAQALSAIVILAGVIASYAVAQYQISELRSDVKELQIKWSSDHDTIIELAADIKWIRQRLEEEK